MTRFSPRSRNSTSPTKRQALLVKRTEYLAKLEGFVAPTAQSDLTKGVLDAEALERLTTFSFAQHETIATEEVELAKQARVLNEQIELLNRKRAEITAGASQTLREAVLFVQKKAEAPAEIRLSYLVNNCGWSPSYTMRAAADRKQGAGRVQRAHPAALRRRLERRRR